MSDHIPPSSTALSPADQDRNGNGQPQDYLRIPGLVFDDVPALIPHEYSAALKFLRFSDFDLDLSYGEYYTLLEPFNRVAHKLVDVFDYCIQALKHGTEPDALCPQSEGAAMNFTPRALTSSLSGFWERLFGRVLDSLGHAAQKVGLCSLDVMWIVYLYTRAWENTSKAYRANDQAYWRRANIHHLHDLLEEWCGMLRVKGLRWTDVFGELFGARQ